jgi:ppGpp synthetase/RelA/SpoT-type nucleotidyltranferase
LRQRMLPDVVWAEPAFGHGRVDAAGKLIVQKYHLRRLTSKDLRELAWAFKVVNNWRSSHAYPLQVAYMTLRTRARSIEAYALVAQRLKRLFSIYQKLDHEPRMKLSQMQDIGGCRAVLPTAAKLFKVAALYEADYARYLRDRERGKVPSDKSIIIEKYDYIYPPKRDGYRGLHFVYRYQTPEGTTHRAHSGLRIEIQLRSKLQHIWATAVEVAQTFTHEALRSEAGHKEWRRFFALMGSSLASLEGLPKAPGTPDSEVELTGELRVLAKNLRVEAVLNAYTLGVSMVQTSVAKAKRFILELDPDKRELRVFPFREGEIEKASAELFASEKNGLRSQDRKLRVLVSVDDVRKLRRAYPNYYLDTAEFIRAVENAIK